MNTRKELEDLLAALDVVCENAAVGGPSAFEKPVQRSPVWTDLRCWVRERNRSDLHLHGGKEDGEGWEDGELHCC